MIAFAGISRCGVVWGLLIFKVVSECRGQGWGLRQGRGVECSFALHFFPVMGQFPFNNSINCCHCAGGARFGRYLPVSKRIYENFSEVTTNNELLGSSLGLTGLHLCHSGQSPHRETQSHLISPRSFWFPIAPQKQIYSGSHIGSQVNT